MESSDISPNDDSATLSWPSHKAPTRPAPDCHGSAELGTAELDKLAQQLGGKIDAPAFPSQDTRKTQDGTAWPDLEGFEILGELGAGGMGRVYLARDRKLDRLVALKTLRTTDWSTSCLQRFEHEIKAATRLNHPSIVTIHDCDLAGKTPFYTMEYVKGCDGRELLKRFKDATAQALGLADLLKIAGLRQDSRADQLRPWAEGPQAYYRLIAWWMAQVAEALQSLHEIGIWHRDIKPGNLMLSPEGRMKIADFGLARTIDDPDVTQSGVLLGSSRYLSPERLTGGRTYDHRSDIYALGMTLYEFLTFHPARTGDSNEQILAEIVSRDPAPPRRVQPKVQEKLERICLQAIARDPQVRYTSAGELARDLLDWLNQPRTQTASTRRWKLGAMVAMAVSGMIGIVLAWPFRGSPSQPNALAVQQASVPPMVESSVQEPLMSATPPAPQWVSTAAPASSEPPRIMLAFVEDDDVSDHTSAMIDGHAYSKFREILQVNENVVIVTPQVLGSIPWTPETALDVARQSGADYVLIGEAVAIPVREVFPDTPNHWRTDPPIHTDESFIQESVQAYSTLQGAVFEWKVQLKVVLLRAADSIVIDSWSITSNQSVIQTRGADPVFDLLRKSAWQLAQDVAQRIEALKPES